MTSTPARFVIVPLLFGAILSGAGLSAAERPAIADFARTPELRNMALSPNGQSVAFLSDFSGRTHLCVADLAAGRNYRFRIGEANFNDSPMPKEVLRFWWVSNERPCW